MNLYFLVEGKTEMKLYPQWLEHLTPSLTRVDYPDKVKKDNYYLISGRGFPSILDTHLYNSALDVTATGDYDYLVISLDAEELTVQQRIQEVKSKVAEKNISLCKCELKIIVQNRCLETWLLGNRKVFARPPKARDFSDCVKFYNVFEDDPELMLKPARFEESIAKFHFKYLKAMLAERNIRYGKNSPKDAAKPYYVQQLKSRLKQTPDHLNTLRNFLNFCDEISRQSAVVD